MTLVPAVLVLHRRQRADPRRTSSGGSTRRWTRSCRRRTRSRATTTTSGSCWSTDHATRIAQGAGGRRSDRSRTSGRIRDLLAPEVTLRRVQMVEVYRVAPANGSLPALAPVVDVAAPSLPAGYSRAAADRLAAQALSAVVRRRARSRRSARPAICCTRRPSSGRRDGRADRRRRRDRLPDRRARRAVAAHDAGVRKLQPAARAEAAADRRLPVVLPDGDAVDSRRRHVDGAVPGEADHAAGADAGGRRARDRRRPSRSARRAAEQRRVRLARRGVQRDGRRAGDAAGARSNDRRSSSSASTSRSKAGAATSRRFSSASRPASCRSTAAARSRRSTARRRGCSASIAPSSASRRRPCSIAPDLQPLGALLAGAGRAEGRAGGAGNRRFRATGQELHLAVVATALVGDSGAPEGAGAGARRRDAADSRAEGRRVARGGAAAGARNQEPADADSAVAPSGCGAISPAARRPRGRWSTSARRRSSARSNR